LRPFPELQPGSHGRYIVNTSDEGQAFELLLSSVSVESALMRLLIHLLVLVKDVLLEVVLFDYNISRSNTARKAREKIQRE
jgi:hypothetical protein